MSQIPYLMAGILSCARLGAVHSVVFAGFSAKALADRINDCEAKLVITNDYGLRGNKKVPLKEILDAALTDCPSVKKALVYPWTG